LTRHFTAPCRGRRKSSRSRGSTGPSGSGATGSTALSYTYLMEELNRVAGPAGSKGPGDPRATWVSGASLAAVREGPVPRDDDGIHPPPRASSWGLAPATLDPGLVVFLAKRPGDVTRAVSTAWSTRSPALLGISETSADVARPPGPAGRPTFPRGRGNRTCFCHRVKSGIGALARSARGPGLPGLLGRQSARERSRDPPPCVLRARVPRDRPPRRAESGRARR